MNTVIFSAIIGGILNRFSGYTNIKWLPGRNIYYAIIVLTALTFYFYGYLWALALFAGSVLYRIPGWNKSLDMGTIAGTLTIDATIMFVRGLYFFPPFLYVFQLTGNWWYLALLPAASAGAVVSYVLGNYVVIKYMKDPFWFIEFFAGVSFGIAIGIILRA
jgi:hypothetical protein